jgi:glutaredoxin
MFTRRGCHLCETCWEQLRQAQLTYGFQLQAVDIDADPRLVELHNHRVPVVAIDGKVRFWGRINLLLLRRLLDAESRRGRETKKPPDSHPGA